MAQRVGSFGYVMEIPLSGIDTVEGKDFRVIIKRPQDNSQIERIAPDVQVIDAEQLVIGVLIKEGDFTQEGSYRYQVIDETAGASIRSDQEIFYVAPSLEPA